MSKHKKRKHKRVADPHDDYMVSTILERHSTVVVLCLFTLSREQEVEKCMC